MSSAIKKIFKGIKKVFKKITKVVKKIVKSKLFKVVAIGVALYFGGAALGAWGGISSGGAASAAGSGLTTASATSATAGQLMTVPLSQSASTVAISSSGASVGASGGLLAKLGSMTSGEAILASTALNIGASAASGMAQAKDEEKEKKRQESIRQEQIRNSETQLNIRESLAQSGYKAPERKEHDEVSSTPSNQSFSVSTQPGNLLSKVVSRPMDSSRTLDPQTLSKTTVGNVYLDSESGKWTNI